MRKLLGLSLGTLTVLIIAFLTCPLVIGLWLKSHYQSLLNQFNTSHNISLKVVSFDRGWFSSDVTVRITIAGQWLKSQSDDIAVRTNPTQLIVHQRIKNGPLVRGKIEKAWIHSQSNDPNFRFTSNTLIGWNNTIDNRFNATSITIANTQQQFVITGLKSHITFSPKNRHLIAKTTLTSVDLSEKQRVIVAPEDYQKRLHLKNVSFQSNVQPSTPLWFGDRDLKIGAVTYLTSQHQSLTLNHITLHDHQSQKNDTAGATVEAHINSLTTDQSSND